MITTHYEEQHWKSGLNIVGVDEAGRGALAGPVVAAAVIFDPQHIPRGLNDSKLLTPIRRRELAAFIKLEAISWAVAFINNHKIDEVNILQATFDAMHEAIDNCCGRVTHGMQLHCLIDGNRFRPHRLAHTTIIHGDAISPSIAAASILAKTARDQFMGEIDGIYPVYQFARHKGYGTLIHRQALYAHGACAIHRSTFLTNVNHAITQFTR